MCIQSTLRSTGVRKRNQTDLLERDGERELTTFLRGLNKLFCYFPPCLTNSRARNHIFPCRPRAFSWFNPLKNIPKKLRWQICPPSFFRNNITADIHNHVHVATATSWQGWGRGWVQHKALWSHPTASWGKFAIKCSARYAPNVIGQIPNKVFKSHSQESRILYIWQDSSLGFSSKQEQVGIFFLYPIPCFNQLLKRANGVWCYLLWIVFAEFLSQSLWKMGILLQQLKEGNLWKLILPWGYQCLFFERTSPNLML